MIVGRFAPSPTGRMHLGNVFSALLCWLSVRSQGGRLVLRIEDLDPARSRPEYTATLLDDLRWLGLHWDDGPQDATPTAAWFQSRRGEFYASQLEILEAKQLLYPCFCSRAQLHAASAPHAADGSYVYNGHCRHLPAAEAAALRHSRAPALRVRVPAIQLAFCDGCQGRYEETLQQATGDYILRRSDGVYAYQLAVVADDGAMGITEVVRGRDLLQSTPRQLWLARQLGWPAPRYYHVPLLLAPDGRRLSKREKDLDLGHIRQTHKTPHALIGALAHLCGLLPSAQPLSATQLLPHFHWGKVCKQDIVVQPSLLQ